MRAVKAHLQLEGVYLQPHEQYCMLRSVRSSSLQQIGQSASSSDELIASNPINFKSSESQCVFGSELGF